MHIEQGLYASAVSKYRLNPRYLDIQEGLTEQQKETLFALQCNGYFVVKGTGQLIFDPKVTKPFAAEFTGQRVSFFGPGASDQFFEGEKVGPLLVVPALERTEVTDAIGKYRKYDEDQAARIAYILGGVIRHLVTQTPDSEISAEEIANKVAFAARMTKLGERKSADAIASTMAMYVISGGSIVKSDRFTGDIYRMAEAISEDTVVPYETADLGGSQVLRIRSFWDRTNSKGDLDFPEVAEHLTNWDGFPTVGAEFHFPPDAPNKNPYFWQRLTLLNMSQYQRGSYIQLSRNDRDVIEVRMNPSVYPITVANWNYMRLLLPELNRAYFTATINRKVTGTP